MMQRGKRDSRQSARTTETGFPAGAISPAATGAEPAGAQHGVHGVVACYVHDW